MKLVLFLSLVALTISCATESQAARHTDDPRTALKRELTVGVVLVQGAFETELAAPIDVFHRTTMHAHPAMQVITIGATREPVRTSAGTLVTPDWSFASAPPIDVLVVPSFENGKQTDLANRELIEFVKTRGRSARFVLSFGNGAFVLAAAGLLDGHRSTTSPADAERMRELYPKLRIAVSEPFVHDGTMITSHGGTRAYDASLNLTEIVAGEPAAMGIAKDLSVDWRSQESASRRDVE